LALVKKLARKDQRLETSESSHPTDGEGQKERHYSRLYRKFVFLTLISSLVPLLLVGWGINIYYSNFSSARMKDYFQSQVEYHRKIIELFLKERRKISNSSP